jgi:very-short-patch-repair endonuclease
MEEESFRRRMVRAAQEARKTATPAEKALWEMVRGERCGEFYFRRQTIIASFRVDFYCAKLRLSIEIDGSIHDEKDVQKRDADRQAILEQDCGIRFLRLSNDDILQHPQQARLHILQTAQLLSQK